MRLRALLVTTVALAMVLATIGPAAATGYSHGGGHGGGGGAPTTVPIDGVIGKKAEGPDALRYVGDPPPRGFADTYLHGDPFISTAPEDGAVTIAGTLDLTNRIADSVAAIGLVEQSALEAGGDARDTGALIYLWTRGDRSMRIGLTDGRDGGEIVQVFRTFAEADVPDVLSITFTVDGTEEPATCADRTDASPPADGGCMTLRLEDAAALGDSYGTIKAATDEEFAGGAVPGWEMFTADGLGDRSGIGYELTVSPVQPGDGDRRPRSKDDCRRGGYATYGFRNQGQCIAWVVHHVGKDRPHRRFHHGRWWHRRHGDHGHGHHGHGPKSKHRWHDRDDRHERRHRGASWSTWHRAAHLDEHSADLRRGSWARRR